MECRCDWTKEEIRAIYDIPFLDLVYLVDPEKLNFLRV